MRGLVTWVVGVPDRARRPESDRTDGRGQRRSTRVRDRRGHRFGRRRTAASMRERCAAPTWSVTTQTCPRTPRATSASRSGDDQDPERAPARSTMPDSEDRQPSLAAGLLVIPGRSARSTRTAPPAGTPKAAPDAKLRPAGPGATPRGWGASSAGCGHGAGHTLDEARLAAVTAAATSLSRCQ